jgi:hypothetical protein
MTVMYFRTYYLCIGFNFILTGVVCFSIHDSNVSYSCGNIFQKIISTSFLQGHGCAFQLILASRTWLYSITSRFDFFLTFYCNHQSLQFCRFQLKRFFLSVTFGLVIVIMLINFMINPFDSCVIPLILHKTAKRIVF